MDWKQGPNLFYSSNLLEMKKALVNPGLPRTTNVRKIGFICFIPGAVNHAIAGDKLGTKRTKGQKFQSGWRATHARAPPQCLYAPQLLSTAPTVLSLCQ